MKSRDEIQRAHDILVSVILEEVKIELEPKDREAIHFATDVLCWVLQHEHNTAFAENLFNLETELAQKGYVLEFRPEKGVII
jgi:hypothetical protein